MYSKSRKIVLLMLKMGDILSLGIQVGLMLKGMLA